MAGDNELVRHGARVGTDDWVLAIARLTDELTAVYPLFLQEFKLQIDPSVERNEQQAARLAVIGRTFGQV